MTFLLDQWERLLMFMDTGGKVMVPIMGATFIMWTLIVERLVYMRFWYPGEADRTVKTWMARADRASWNAVQIRQGMVSELSQRLRRSLSIIKTLISLCLLLGLLGTVTGMIEVFTVMALVGSGNPRAMASGVSMATIPTMSGMVAALSGMYFGARLERMAKRNIARMDDALATERDKECAAA